MALFSDLTDDDFKHVHLPVDDISIDAGAMLYNAGDRAVSLFTLRHGLVKLTHYLSDGSQRVVRLVRPGGTIGLEALCSDQFSHYAEAVQDSQLCRIPVAVVERLDRESPHLHQQLLQRWHQAVLDSDQWLTQMSTGSARERVARLCLFLRDDKTGTCHLPGREDIGAMLGITTETASRIIADFRRRGVVTALTRSHFSLDNKALQSVSGMCDEAA
ncbi:MAG: Crp/Fnr family transcriptional regulator [Pseudomonadota bacterium]